MTTFVPLLSRAQIDQLPERARVVVEYRKSGLSLNHIQGCPLDCAYCIRHTYDLWDQRQPRALMSDAQAVDELVGHRYFQPHVTPVQLFNRSTDPFLPGVRSHTFAVLEDLDGRGLRNHVLVITRHQMKPQDAARLNHITNIKVTLLFTYSGIDNKQIEPYPSIVFTGLFYRDQIAEYYKANGLPEPYRDTARRKIVPETLEQRVLAAFSVSSPLFRKTSCAVSYVHGRPDYNGHYGVRELCDICPLSQLELCRGAHRVPTPSQIHEVARVLPEAQGLVVIDITDRAAVVAGLTDEQPRYYLQHALRFQVHDVRHPHHGPRHGRADVGWKDTAQDG